MFYFTLEYYRKKNGHIKLSPPPVPPNLEKIGHSVCDRRSPQKVAKHSRKKQLLHENWQKMAKKHIEKEGDLTSDRGPNAKPD